MTLNKTAIVKYDAFKDVGGKLSFALAMLDKENSGFCIKCDPQQRRLLYLCQRNRKRRVLYRAWRRRKEALRQAVNAHNDIG